MSTAADILVAFQPAHNFFVGIDSDGCAFDAMEIKHQECFTPATIKCWDLQAVAKVARETALFVNLYSTYRGLNRWVALVRFFELLAEREEVKRRGVEVPSGDKLKRFIASGEFPLSDSGLRAYATVHPDPELDRGLAWSAAVNAAIEEMVKGVPPFPYVLASVQKMAPCVDLMVVSATPVEALEREWGEHGLAPYMDVIAGQEMGTKAQHLELAAKGKYADENILMIGDAPGDRDAAKATGVMYYPINPGREEQSWKRFHYEALDRFLTGGYAGGYEAAVIAEFEALLPDTPPWKR